MDLGDLAINGAYLVSFAALTVRDVLRLRVLLLGAQLLFVSWGLLLAYWPTVAWNLTFVVINTVVIIRILRERRPLALPEVYRDIHERRFASMSTREFLLFWELGNPHRQSEGALVRQGEHPESLKMLLEGSARVIRDGVHVADVVRGDFVAEMSLLTGHAASADVTADGPVAFVSWSRRKLETLERLNPEVYLELHKALGRDVSAKAMAHGEATVRQAPLPPARSGG